MPYRQLNLANERAERIAIKRGQGPVVMAAHRAKTTEYAAIATAFLQAAKAVRALGYGGSYEADQLVILRKDAATKLAKVNPAETLQKNLQAQEAEIINGSIRARGKVAQVDPIERIVSRFERQEIRQNQIRLQEQSRREHAAMLASQPEGALLSDQERKWSCPITRDFLEACREYDRATLEDFVAALADAPKGCEILSKEVIAEGMDLLSRKACAANYATKESLLCRMEQMQELEHAMADIIANPWSSDPISGFTGPTSDEERRRLAAVPHSDN